MPSSFFKSKDLASWRLDQNKSEGPIPTCVGKRTSLLSMGLSVNSLSRTLPESLCNMEVADASCRRCPCLETRYMTGSLPECISSLQKLGSLRVASKSIGGNLPRAIWNMTSLTVLDLSENTIGGTVPRSLSLLSTQLDTMNLELNYLSCLTCHPSASHVSPRFSC